MEKKKIIVPRVGLIVIEDESILLVKSDYGTGLFWTVPGGGLDFEESLENCGVREIKEETGLDVKIERFLYLREYIPHNDKDHVIDMYFLAKRIGGKLKTGNDPDHKKQVIRSAEFVKIKDLGKIKIFPEVLPELLEKGLRDNFSDEPRFLGPC
jgi:8-oxo-dGTP diphosphatase